jgi:hypothetical protein
VANNGTTTQTAAPSHFKVSTAAPKPGPTDPVEATAGNGSTVIFTYADGSKKTAKGNIPNRCNNPGNIVFGNFARSHGAIGRAGGEGNKRFAVFPNAQMGFAALIALLRDPSYQKLTLAEAINRYAPPSENNTSGYQKHVSTQTGIQLTAKLSTISEDQLTKLGNAIAKIEGFSTGALV